MKLTNKQELFIQYYMISLNATDAAIKAGYKAKTAKEIGYENLTKPHIRSGIDSRLTKRAQDNGITADYVLSSLKSIAERCQQQEPVRDKQGKETGEYKFDSGGANKSLELLGKYLKLFTEKIETSGETTVNNKVDLKGFTTEQIKEMLKD